MSTADPFEGFLDAADKLRDDDAKNRITAHTSSVSADGWEAESAPGEGAAEAAD